MNTTKIIILVIITLAVIYYFWNNSARVRTKKINPETDSANTERCNGDSMGGGYRVRCD